jgi:hypothetical protein
VAAAPMQNGGITFVEEPVVVVRRECHHQVGLERRGERAGPAQRRVDLGAHPPLAGSCRPTSGE